MQNIPQKSRYLASLNLFKRDKEEKVLLEDYQIVEIVDSHLILADEVNEIVHGFALVKVSKATAISIKDLNENGMVII